MRDTTIRSLEVPPGLELEYAERGEGEAILFLHGYTDSRVSYDLVLPLLPGGFRALAPTQRGHGRSGKPASDYRMERFAADAVAFLDALDVGRATVVGHSMGSLVAREVALAAPERVSRLVLIGSAPSFDNPTVRELEESVRNLSDPVPRDFAFDFQASCVQQTPPEHLLDRVTDEGSMHLRARLWRDALTACIAYDGEAHLSAISVPTLIVGGDGDAICSVPDQLRLQAAIPGSRVLIYEETGHCPHWERPERFVDDLMAFLTLP